MDEATALQRMVAPAEHRPGKWPTPRLGKFGGVMQIWVTRQCDKACFGCTQGSNLRGKSPPITPAQFEEVLLSLRPRDPDGYPGVIGMFGGNPALHPQFEELCALVRKYVPKERAGIWCNKPFGKAPIMRQTFTPHFSNLNVHLDRAAYDEFKRDWPESRPCGLDSDSRHSPVFTALQDLVPDEGERWAMISSCDINHHWSAMFGAFRGEARFWFCEIAGAQAILHQDDPNWPDTGRPVTPDCWRGAMVDYADQVRFHCHRCGIPFRGHGELAQASDAAGVEQVSQTHADIYKPKRPSRTVQLVQLRTDVREATLPNMVDYIGNARKK